ncbi:hypothetical protein D0862_15304 [Hortaea werneckii]|uniref:Retrotransposon gag domain-containing protein n=1 Tax=Hortaea werneckii TaxID=91943 RepID=A0A3M7DL32_HORWE|nr:hypothetical protein D0862_15304 [Hortaea werneckii]
MIFFKEEGVRQDTKKTIIASSYLRGQAQQWIRPRLQQALNTFVETIRNIYGLSNDKQVAIRYTAKFREYSTKTSWNDQALTTMYYRGLKDNVKDELMRSSAAQDTLERLIIAAIEIDNKLYERQQEKRHNGQYRGRSSYNPTSWTRGSRRDPNAMELDII